MRVVRWGVVVGAALGPGLAVGAFNAGAAAGAAHGCRVPLSAKVIARTPGQLLAWQTKTAHPSSTTVVVCVPPNGAPHSIYHHTNSITQSESVDMVQSAGSRIAFVVEAGDQYGSSQTLEGFNARNGHKVFEVDFADSTVSSGDPSALVSYALDAGGDVAWVETPPVGMTGAGTDTLMLRTRGQPQMLDSATTITSVAFAGGQLQWVSDGQAKSAPVPPA